MLTIGDVIDRKYRIVRQLGEGGMGAVYEAEHEAIRRRVAIKVLFPNFAHEPEMVLRFHREAEAAGRIGHDNICEVIDIGQLPSGAPYLVMPLLKGEPLSETIQRDAPFDIDRAVDITCQVLEALSAAHAAGIIHRDLKPDNLFLTRLGDRGIEFVKVLDFGISKVLGAASVDEHKQVTRTGMVLGTPSYMAPEQARGKKDVDHRADLYAVGAILFEMLTGRRAFDGETFNDVLIKVVVEPVPPPRTLRPEIPPEVEAVVLRAMQREPADRYRTAAEFRSELLSAREAARSGGPVAVVERTAAAPPVPPPTARTPEGTVAGRSTAATIVPRRRRISVPVAVAGAVVVLAVAAGVLWTGRDAARSAKDGPAPQESRVAASAPFARERSAGESPRPASNVEASVSPADAASPPAPADVSTAPPPPDPASAEPTRGDATGPAPTSEDVVHLTFTGVPRGATVTVGENPIPGTEAAVPRSTTPLPVAVSAPGFETFRENVVPSTDRVIRVRMRRSGGGNVAARDAGGSRGAAGTEDAGRAEVRLISGRLGTAVVDDRNNR